MRTPYHLLLNLAVVSLAFISGYKDIYGLILFLVLGTLIDIDHLLFYAFTEKRFNVLAAYKNWEDFIQKFSANEILLIFHNLEFFLVALLITYVCGIYFTLILTSLLIHYFMDILDAVFLVKSKRSWSILYFFLNKLGKTHLS